MSLCHCNTYTVNMGSLLPSYDGYIEGLGDYLQTAGTFEQYYPRSQLASQFAAVEKSVMSMHVDFKVSLWITTYTYISGSHFNRALMVGLNQELPYFGWSISTEHDLYPSFWSWTHVLFCCARPCSGRAYLPAATGFRKCAGPHSTSRRSQFIG